jgi:hypothetical protein
MYGRQWSQKCEISGFSLTNWGLCTVKGVAFDRKTGFSRKLPGLLCEEFHISYWILYAAFLRVFRSRSLSEEYNSETANVQEIGTVL